MSARISQAEPRHQRSRPARRIDHIAVETVEPELGAPEHREGALGSNRSPREVDEALLRTPLEVWPLEVDAVGGHDGVAVELPPHRRSVGRDHPERFIGAVAALDGDVDVLVSGKVAARGAGEARQVRTQDANLHRPSVARPALPVSAGEIGLAR
jgi:hypothetical protein